MKSNTITPIKILKFCIGLIVSVGFIYLFVKKVDSLNLDRIRTTELNPLYILISVFFYILSQWFRAMSWSKGFDSTLETKNVFQAVCIGNGGNMLLPFRLGEALRIGSLQQLEPNKKVVGNTLFLISERLIDVVILCLIAVITTFFVSFEEDIQRRVDYIKVLVGLGALFSPILYYLLKKSFFGERLKDFLMNLQLLTIKNWLGAFLFLCLSWFMVYSSLIMGILSIGSEANILMGGLLVLVFTNLGMLIPAAPGGIGVFQYVSVLGLSMASFTNTEASILAILLHLIQYAALIPIAAIIFIKLNLKTTINGKPL